MKIGFFTDSYLPQLNGLTTSVETCARALEKRGHEVYVIAPRYPRYKDKKKNVYRLTSVKFINSPEMRWTLQLPEKPLLEILRLNFDIIHGHSGGGMTLLGLQIARVKGVPCVGTYHTLFNHYAHYFFKGKIITPKMLEVATKFIGNLFDYIIAPTEVVKKELLLYGVKKPIHTLPSGIDLDNYKLLEKGFIRNKVKIAKKVKILLHVGRLGKEKSIDFIIKSFKLIFEKDPNTVLVLIGDGPEKQNLKKIVDKLGLNNNILFLGNIRHQDVAKVYADADLFVFASQTETQGLVVTEALASGLPVVAVDDEALFGVVNDGENGYLVKKDANLFAKKVIKLLDNNELYKKFSDVAQKSVKKFSANKMAENMEALYMKLIKEKGEKNKTININRKTIADLLKKINIQIKNILYLD